MTITSRRLASGPGWRVADKSCSAGPRDRPFEEQHDAACIALVTAGTFRYRCPQGKVLLSPGAILLGSAGQCFECGHEHHAGDRCLSFSLSSAFLESVVAGVPGVRRIDFPVPRLPPLTSLLPLIAEAHFARDTQDALALEELALRLSESVFATLGGCRARAALQPTRRTARQRGLALH